MADRYIAQIDGFELDVETLEDGFEMSIARYEYPYRNGAELENMGQRARTIRIRCYWLEDRYAEHFDFIEHLKSRELFELTHPKYGLVKGFVESVSIRHDDREETAEVDLTFVQDLLSQEGAEYCPDIEATTDENFAAGQAELMDYFKSQARSALGTEARDILDQELYPELGISEQFAGVSPTARTWLNNVETVVDTWDATATDAANPANSLLSTISFGNTLPGRVIGPVARVVERYARLRDGLAGSPERFVDGLKQNLAELRNVSGALTGASRIAGAQRISLEAGTLFKADEQKRDVLRRIENQKTFDISGHRLNVETAEPVMDARVLERSLAAIRTEIQAAIDVDRSQSSLKKMAADLLEHVTVIKLERDRISKILLDNPMPLHLVCLAHGLPYRYAERILAINDMRHPAFASGEVSIYVR